MKTSQSAGNLPTTAIQCTTFANRIFPILSMSFRKSSTFSKRATSSMTWFSRFVKSISQLTGIRTGNLEKTILSAENSPTTLLPKAAVFYTEVRIVSLIGKKTTQAFHKRQFWPNTSTRRPSNFIPKKGGRKGRKLVEIEQNPGCKQQERAHAAWSCIEQNDAVWAPL